MSEQVTARLRELLANLKNRALSELKCNETDHEECARRGSHSPCECATCELARYIIEETNAAPALLDTLEAQAPHLAAEVAAEALKRFSAGDWAWLLEQKEAGARLRQEAGN